MDPLNMTSYFLLPISIAFISMALFVLLQRKPLILNSIWMLVCILLCFLPLILTSAQKCFTQSSFNSILPFIMWSVIIGWYVITMKKGFAIYGVDGTDFQRIFIECLNDKNYEYEQTLSSIKIKNPELELSVSIMPWIGSAQIRFKGKANHEVLNEIINDLKAKKIKTNLIYPVFYLLIGVMMASLSISMVIKY